MGNKKTITAERISMKMREFNLKRKDVLAFINSNGNKIQISSVDAWLDGRNNPNSENVTKLAKLFHTTIEYLRGVDNIDAPSPDVGKIKAALGLSTESIQTLYTSQGKYLEARRMSPPGVLFSNHKYAELLFVINALLDSDTGKELVHALYKVLFEDNKIFLRTVDENYQIMQTHPHDDNWTDEEYLQQREIALERGHKVSEIFLIEKENALREIIKQKREVINNGE